MSKMDKPFDALGVKTSNQISLLKSILRSTSEYAIFAKDLNHKILIWNEGAKQLYGYSSQEILHKNSHILYHPNDVKLGKIKDIFALVEKKGSWSGELKGVTKEGNEFIALVNISIRKNSKGKKIGYTLIARDMTDLQRILETMSKLKESENILHLKNTELNERIIEAVEANRLKTEFLANMSHELRTPLNGIIGFSQMLMKNKVGDTNDKQKKYIENIFNSAHQLLFLINDLLDFAKVSSGKLQFNPEKINVSKLLEEIYEFFKPNLDNRNLTISIDESLDNIVIDPLRLKQIFNNYISNAIKFTHESGEIKVKITKDKEDYFCIAVEDNGIGIQKNDLKSLFEHFHQLSTGSAKQYQGTGLGLALTRQIVEAQGGHVDVQSIYGHGSTFYAFLPIRPQLIQELEKVEHSKPTQPKILIIEQQSQQRLALLDALFNAGFNTAFVDNISEILQKPEILNIDAIVLDFFLPDINNWRILKAMHTKKYSYGFLPILILVIAQEAGNYGFRIQDFLIKPIVPENLISSLEIAGASPHQNKSILIVDDNKKIMKDTKAFLTKLGYRIFCKSNKNSALDLAQKETIDVVIVDLLMSEVDGLDFLMQFKHLEHSKNTMIIIWRAENIEEAELNHLKLRVQQNVLKAEDISKSLLNEFIKSFPLLNARKE